MSDLSNNVTFAVGGAVQIKDGTYLERPADQELFETCQANEFSYVLACRQIGKSSLMVETARRLSEKGIRTASIDLNHFGHEVEADKWYFSLIDALVHRLKLEVDVQEWWDARPRLSTVSSRFLEFFRDIVLQEIKEPIVIFIDEIDGTLGLPFTDDFFAAIRTIYNERTHEPDYQRLTFVLLGVATPDELIKDNTRTPFNTAKAIMLSDFTEAECLPFRRAIESDYPDQGSRYFDQIYAWTAGHPYLTQKLCEAVLKRKKSEEAAPDSTLIDSLVKELFLAAAIRSEDNIQFVQTRVINDQYAQTMLRLYQGVLRKKSIPDKEQSPAINRLKLYGLVVAREDKLEVRNKLYAQAFDSTWADEMLRSTHLGLPSKYRILQRIGQRGFVKVYLAELQEADNTQDIALRVLDVPDELQAGWAELIKRLEHETKVISEANHPHIVPILEVGLIDEKTLYIAMEYMAGGKLHDKLEDKPMSRNKAVEIIRRVGAALVHIHTRGILHLGVNPKDILFEAQQEEARPFLDNFGFAKLLPEKQHSQIRHDYVMLTPDYVAPEVGQVEELTPAADVYSLAVTFFVMLAGQLPAERQPGQVLPPLSKINPEIGELFDETLIKATAKDPADRYQNVEDFLEALNANLQSEVVELINVAAAYINIGKYDPKIALDMIEDVFELYPAQAEALRLRGRIRLKQGQVDEALTDYQQAYEAGSNRDPGSEIGREYLATLNQVAADAWQKRAYPEAVKHYRTIKQILSVWEYDPETNEIGQQAQARLVEYYYNEGNEAYHTGNIERIEETIGALDELGVDVEKQELQEKLRDLRIKQHYGAALEIYAAGEPKNIEAAIETLAEKIEALEDLQATDQSRALSDKRRLLQIKNYRNMIDAQEAFINRINDEGQSSEEVFQPYLEIDAAYQQLLELEPGHEQWLTDRRKKLNEQARWRLLFAERAERQLRFEAAVAHFQTIRNIEETNYPTLSQELELELPLKLAELEKKVGHDQKYNQIKALITNKKYIQALDKLDKDFIRPGIYEHRDVVKTFWALVHAKQYGGKFPPEWNSSEKEKELGQVQAEAEAIQIKLGHVERKLEQARQEATSKGRRLSTAQKKLAKMEAKLAETEQELGLIQTEAVRTREQLANTKKTLDKVQAEQSETGQRLAEIEQHLERVQTEAKEKQDELADKEMNLTLIRNVLYWYKKQHEINKFTIPISLFVAVIAGGIMAPRMENLPGLSMMVGLAFLLLIVYFGYYAWAYYIQKP